MQVQVQNCIVTMRLNHCLISTRGNHLQREYYLLKKKDERQIAEP